MVTVEQVQRGLSRWVDADVIPHLTGARRLGLGVWAGLAAAGLGKAVERYKDHPAVQMLDILQEDGTVDLDKVYQTALPLFQGGEKYAFSLPVIGEMTVDRSDLEKLYQYIKEA